jgi:hypothetical protein
MNFIAAIQHAGIGYGIRRTCWHGDAILHTNNMHELPWLTRKGEDQPYAAPFAKDRAQSAHEITMEDVMAQDWDTV